MSVVTSVMRLDIAPCDHAVVHALQQELGCSETMAWVLARRGLVDPGQARSFLEHGDGESPFHDPMLLGDMAAAVERIQFAIADGQPIAVHGDYDADGVCATTLLVEAIEALGGEVRPFLPSRFSNGYGMHVDTIERFALDGIRLVIAVDCGITAVEAVAHARDHGMDVIIVDHHQPGAELPAAILCSTRPSNYPFIDLCATGAVGKLVQALGAPYGDAQHELEAIATVADVVPLVGENRAIVRRGLRALRRTQRPGLRALMSTCDLHATDADEEHIAFRIAPRINAAGRLYESEIAYELLRCEDPDVATRVAGQLHGANAERKLIEQDIVASAIAQVESWPKRLQNARAYVISGRDWHEGVVGIVASRLVERYRRPVIVISELEPMSRGSGRSIPAFDLRAALDACSQSLTRYGGHRSAVGVTIESSAIHAFREAMVAHAAATITDDDLIVRERVDSLVAGGELSIDLVEELSQLAPFGHGNPRPRLMLPAAALTQLRTVGERADHLQGTAQAGGETVRIIAFGHGERMATLSSASRVDIVGTLSINRFRGAETLQFVADALIELDGDAGLPDGACASGCTIACPDRLPLEVVVERARSIDVQDEWSDSLPGLEAILIRARCVDLRHQGRIIAHVSRLIAAGTSVIAVVADVPRRRRQLLDSISPVRLGARSIALASTGCEGSRMRGRLDRVMSVDGTWLAIVDHDSVEAVAAAVSHRPGTKHVVAVIDPPMTVAQRDSLARIDAPIHLLGGAAQERFSAEVAAGSRDVRELLGPVWRALRESPLDRDTLEAKVHGEDGTLRSGVALARGMSTLARRGFFTFGDGATILAHHPGSDEG